MIRKPYVGMMLLGVAIGAIASGRIVVRAQDRGDTRPHPGRPEATIEKPADMPATSASRPSGSAIVQDVLLRPFHFPFKDPTPLVQVCTHLKQALGVPVVLDLAALERQEVEPQDTVRLELDGVRLKTGLKLLLDQVGLTYQVVPEDNLLILTDREGAEDPLDRIREELRSLHRDLHDVMDAVDDLTDALYGEEEEGARVRKPTIIEEKPGADPGAPEPEAEKGEKAPGQKPGARPSPPPRSRTSRDPHAKPGRTL